jgi:alkylation response protein AidB-like acyl-CoA dehydrogenase
MKDKIHDLFPEEYLEDKVIEALRGDADAAEMEGKLTTRQLDIIHEQGLLNLYVPSSFGGLERTLPEILKTEESLARLDGSLAWVITLCSGASWFIGFLDPSLRNVIFKGERVLIAGSGAVTGTAEITDQGYRVNGYWPYATGASYATHFTANCYLMQEGQPLYHDDKSRQVKSFVFMKDEVTLLNTWKGMGMRATSTHAFEIKERNIPFNRSFVIDASHTYLPQIIFQYPFLQLADTTLAVNILGMALRFLEISSEILSSKYKPSSEEQTRVLTLLGEHQRHILKLREEFYIIVDTSWSTLERERCIPPAVLKEVSQRSLSMVKACRHVVNDLYPYLGLGAAATDTEINRVWRNLHTAGQHALFSREI